MTAAKSRSERRDAPARARATEAMTWPQVLAGAAVGALLGLFIHSGYWAAGLSARLDPEASA